MSLFKCRLAAIVSIIVLSSCGGSDEDDNSRVTSSLPVVPDEASASATVEGVDANANGIRDEIEHHLHNTYSDAQVRSAYSNFVLGIQGMQLAYAENPVNRQALANAATIIDHSIECAYSLQTPEEVIHHVRDLRERMLDTTARVQAYFRADQLLSGEIFPSVEVAQRSTRCL